MTKFNMLTDEQDEILTIMEEECAEIIQAICKIKRHGYTSHHPSSDETNHEALVREMGDLKCITEIWFKSQGASAHVIKSMIERHGLEKLSTLPRYTHHIDWTKY